MLTTSPVVVSVDGMVLSGSLDPALGGQAYMVGEAPGVEYVFPSEGWGKDELYRSFSAKSWTLSKTT